MAFVVKETQCVSRCDKESVIRCGQEDLRFLSTKLLARVPTGDVWEVFGDKKVCAACWNGG